MEYINTHHIDKMKYSLKERSKQAQNVLKMTILPELLALKRMDWWDKDARFSQHYKSCNCDAFHKISGRKVCSPVRKYLDIIVKYQFVSVCLIKECSLKVNILFLLKKKDWIIC